MRIMKVYYYLKFRFGFEHFQTFLQGIAGGNRTEATAKSTMADITRSFESAAGSNCSFVGLQLFTDFAGKGDIIPYQQCIDQSSSTFASDNIQKKLGCVQSQFCCIRYCK